MPDEPLTLVTTRVELSFDYPDAWAEPTEVERNVRAALGESLKPVCVGAVSVLVLPVGTLLEAEEAKESSQ
jgi:hypothetical protein